VQQHKGSVIDTDKAWVSLCCLYIVWTLSTADCERGFSLLKSIKTAARNRLSYEVLNQLMMIVSNGPNLAEFDFDEAARVFIGSKPRRKVNVQSLQTPSARQAAHKAVYKWTKAEATKAFEAHLQMAKDLATGERITDRQVGSEITAESRQNRARIRKQDEKRTDSTRARGRASSHKPKKTKKRKSKTPRSSSSSSQSMQLEQPELDDEDSAAASPPKKKSRTATAPGVSFHKTSGGRVSKPYIHPGDLYYNVY